MSMALGLPNDAASASWRNDINDKSRASNEYRIMHRLLALALLPLARGAVVGVIIDSDAMSESADVAEALMISASEAVLVSAMA